MRILSHRGYWKSEKEKNNEIAFKRSFSLGFGTETDIRDYNEQLIISHDIATGKEISLSEFLSIVTNNKNSETLTLALNIKSDGLAIPLANILKDNPALDYFVFDMSIPDMRSYFDVGIPVFTRMSEVEPSPVWLEHSDGVWLDSFENEWFDISTIRSLLNKGKRVCIVSPELHKRKYLTFWESIKPLTHEPKLMLCTDFPEHANEFFFHSA